MIKTTAIVILAVAFFGLGSSGIAQTKADSKDEKAIKILILERIEPGAIRVRLYGKSAVIRYQARLRVSVKGSPGRPFRFWHTDLYEKRNGQWQIVWSHATQIND